MAISQPPPKNLDEIIHSKHYVIPRYQRPYSWDVEHITELFYDIQGNESPYFVGTLILRPTGTGNVFEVVDGQQRLATLLLLLKAAMIVLKAVDEDGSKEILDRYLNQKLPLAKEPIVTLVLSKRDRDKFNSLLLGTEFTSKKPYVSWKKLDQALSFFKEKLEVVKTERGIEGLKEFILTKVMTLTFLEVHVQNNSDVYLFFETLNDRGMDLSIADLVKNRVCATAKDDEEAADDAARRIDDISDLLGGGRIKSFLLHYCWSKSDASNPIPKKQLMNWYNTTIEKESTSFLGDLEDHALAYADFVDPEKIKPTGAKKEILRYLKALNATRCYPLLLQAEKSLNAREFERLCAAIEILTFRHSTVTQKDAKQLEGVYYRLTKDILNKVGFDEILKALRNQAAEIHDDVFVPAFATYEPENHQVARYVLYKIENYLGKDAQPVDWETLTLEHILPEGSDWDGKDVYLDRLGNYTLLSKRLNKTASNKSFIEKREQYKEETRINITQELLAYKDFNKDDVVSRQKKLAGYATKVWSPSMIK